MKMNTKEWLPVTELTEQNRKHFDEEIKSLIEMCDQYPDIAEFVHVLIIGLLADKDSEEYHVADVLSGLVYEIYSIDIRSSLTNPYHYQGNWLYNLNSFIGNFFLDDSYFTITKTGSFGTWEAKSDCDDGCQKPLALIAAARDNNRFYRKHDELTGREALRFMRDGMESSGEVERCLQEVS